MSQPGSGLPSETLSSVLRQMAPMGKGPRYSVTS